MKNIRLSEKKKGRKKLGSDEGSFEHKWGVLISFFPSSSSRNRAFEMFTVSGVPVDFCISYGTAETEEGGREREREIVGTQLRPAFVKKIAVV